MVGGGGRRSAMLEFLNFISDLRLMDLELAGGLYTWSNGKSSQSWSRIDHFLVSSG